VLVSSQWSSRIPSPVLRTLVPIRAWLLLASVSIRYDAWTPATAPTLDVSTTIFTAAATFSNDGSHGVAVQHSIGGYCYQQQNEPQSDSQSGSSSCSSSDDEYYNYPKDGYQDDFHSPFVSTTELQIDNKGACRHQDDCAIGRYYYW
jgi:hypothetical protein